MENTVIPKKINVVPRGIIIKSYGNLLRGEMGIETEGTHSQAIEKEIKKKTANCVFFLFIHANDQPGYEKNALGLLKQALDYR